MFFLLLTSFTVCCAILDCLSSTESLILSIRCRMYSACSFWYMQANSFCAFLSFKALVLVGFFLLHLEAVFTSTRFFLTANVSYGTLGLALCLVGMLPLLRGHCRNLYSMSTHTRTFNSLYVQYACKWHYVERIFKRIPWQNYTYIVRWISNLWKGYKKLTC